LTKCSGPKIVTKTIEKEILIEKNKDRLLRFVLDSIENSKKIKDVKSITKVAVSFKRTGVKAGLVSIAPPDKMPDTCVEYLVYKDTASRVFTFSDSWSSFRGSVKGDSISLDTISFKANIYLAKVKKKIGLFKKKEVVIAKSDNPYINLDNIEHIEVETKRPLARILTNCVIFTLGAFTGIYLVN